MKKLTLIVTALAVLSLASCKKAYDCTCEEVETSRTYTAVMSDYDTYVDDANDAYADEVAEDVTTTVTSIDKTSKAAANSACASATTTDVYEQADYSDADDDLDYYEVAYSVESVYTTTCTLEKK